MLDSTLMICYTKDRGFDFRTNLRKMLYIRSPALLSLRRSSKLSRVLFAKKPLYISHLKPALNCRSRISVFTYASQMCVFPSLTAPIWTAAPLKWFIDSTISLIKLKNFLAWSFLSKPIDREVDSRHTFVERKFLKIFSAWSFYIGDTRIVEDMLSIFLRCSLEVK